MGSIGESRVDTTPWLPFETPDRFTLAMKIGAVQVFELHATLEEAETAYRDPFERGCSGE